MSEINIKYGRQDLREPLDRGDILLHSHEGWRRRFSNLARREIPRIMMAFGLVFLVVLALSYVLFMIDPVGPSRLMFMMIILVLSILTLVIYLGLFVFIKVGLSQNPTPGVYENGLQVPFSIFLPWDEIRALKHIKMGIKKDPWIAINLRFERELTRRLRKRYKGGDYAISTEFLGTDGIQVIEERTGVDVTG